MDKLGFIRYFGITLAIGLIAGISILVLTFVSVYVIAEWVQVTDNFTGGFWIGICFTLSCSISVSVAGKLEKWWL